MKIYFFYFNKINLITLNKACIKKNNKIKIYCQ